MDPQQELFTIMLLKIQELGYDVYDGELPSKGAPYPFIYLGDSHQIDVSNKTAVFGKVYQTIHVWNNNPRQRGTVSSMLLEIKRMCRSIRDTDNFLWCLENMEQRILPDDTAKLPLLHGILEAEFRFY